MEIPHNKPGLAKYLSPLDVCSMAFGCMVGWGAFVMPGSTFLPIAGPAGTLCALAISILIMLIVGSCLSFLMNRIPGTGGIYSYTKNAFGRDHAFLSSWFLCLSYLSIVFLNATALFIVVRTLFGKALQTGYQYTIAGNTIYLREVALSVAVLVAAGILMVLAKAFLQKLVTALAIMMLAGTIILAIFCLPHALSSGVLGSFGYEPVGTGYAIFSIVILAPWAFVGFDVVSFDTAHFTFSGKKIARVIALSILIAGFLYAAMTVISVSAMPDGYSSWQSYIADIGSLHGVDAVPSFFAAQNILGSFGLILIGITALAAILTSIIGAYRATARVLATMAEDKILSDKFLNTTTSILFVMVISIIISFLGQNALNWFVDMTSFRAVVGYGYSCAAAWKISKAEGNKKVLLLSIAGTVISAAFAIVHLIPNLTAMEVVGQESFLLLSLWCLLGFIFYWRTVRHSRLAESNGISTSGVILFALLLYSALLWFAKLLLSRDNAQAMHEAIAHYGIILMLIIFVGLAVMLYIQNMVRKKHEALERENIRAVESSLAKSQFLFNMSHDIRTPMNAIIGYTNLAKQEDMSEPAREYLDKIDTSSHHLLALINDILEMSRIESGKVELTYEQLNLRLLMEEVRDLFSPQMAAKGIDFTVSHSQLQHPDVWCDHNNINRVLLNVISNAYKFTPMGGTVSVSIWEISSDAPGYGTYEIRVQDSGIGMSREFADKMFHAFERERTSTESKTEGTGLGLAITKSIIDLMGGTIDVITSPGSGTEMIIRLALRLAEENPQEEPAPSSAPSEPAQSAQIDYSQKRLLLVEDNDVNREIALMILSQYGFMLETAPNGQVALDMVKASPHGYYDAILMDIQMPVMNGYEATRAIRSLDDPALANIPIIAITANAFKEDEQTALEAGMQAHIAKPLDVEVMMRTIYNVLVQSSLIR